MKSNAEGNYREDNCMSKRIKQVLEKQVRFSCPLASTVDYGLIFLALKGIPCPAVVICLNTRMSV